MSNPPPMIRNVEEVIDRMGLSEKTITNMLPTDFIDPEICAQYGIETMEDLLEVLETLGEEGIEEVDETAIVYQMLPVESKIQTKDFAVTGTTALSSNQHRGSFWCNRDLKSVNIEICMGCTTFFGGYNKNTCVLTCNYKFTM